MSTCLQTEWRRVFFLVVKVVRRLGGFDAICQKRQWKQVGAQLGFPSHVALTTALRKNYKKFLYPYDLFLAGDMNKTRSFGLSLSPGTVSLCAPAAGFRAYTRACAFAAACLGFCGMARAVSRPCSTSLITPHATNTTHNAFVCGLCSRGPNRHCCERAASAIAVDQR